MSSAWAVVLDHDRVRVYAANDAKTIADVPWQPQAEGAAVGALGAIVPRPSRVVLIVGLAFLEATPISLPPVSVASQRRMLRLDADRWFPLVPVSRLEEPSRGEDSRDGHVPLEAMPVAVAVAQDVAFAMSAERLTEWVRAFGTIAPVDAIVTLPQAAWIAGVTGALVTSAAPGERGLVDIADDRLVAVRRTRHPDDGARAPLDEARCAHAALRAGALPLDVQLLDESLESQLASRRRMSWWRASAACAAALVFCVWGADQWRERARREALAGRVSLEQTAAPALAADALRQRALAERQLIADDSVLHISRIVALLGERLPSDVFVQRAEFDGSGWRIDGSARDAAALVPLLSALEGVRDVRALAPSTRFLDSGQQRSSFSIGFRVAPAPSPTGAP